MNLHFLNEKRVHLFMAMLALGSYKLPEGNERNIKISGKEIKKFIGGITQSLKLSKQFKPDLSSHPRRG